MGVHAGDNKLVITAEPKTIHFDLTKDVYNNLKDQIDSTIKQNKLLAEHAIKNDIRQLFSKYKYGNDIQEHGKQ